MLPADVCIAGSAGKCVSGPFVVLDKPLLPFSGAAAACAKAGKKLATIDKIFGGTGAAKPHVDVYSPSIESRVAAQCFHCTRTQLRLRGWCSSFKLMWVVQLLQTDPLSLPPRLLSSSAWARTTR